ncbi:MAG: aminopeptidase [Desulfobacteraceae bacterium]|nr:aminopeptidase [Desulfobacteraceae bacterium]
MNSPMCRRHLQRYADVLLWGLEKARKKPFRKGNIVVVRFDPAATELAEVLYERLLDRRIHPVQRVNPTPVMEKALFTRGDDHQVGFRPPGERRLLANLNGSIVLHAPDSLTHLARVDPGRIARAAMARKPLRDIMERRESSGDLGWTLCTYPTRALADQAKMSLSEYADQIVKACFLHRKSPLDHWESVFARARQIKHRLQSLSIGRLHVESRNIDLRITPGEKRKWLGVSGRNIPSFEIFLSPDWRGTNGVYYANQPSYRNGNIVAGVRLQFADGTLRSASAELGEAFLKKQIGMDVGAGRVGEFSLTDRRFSRIDRFMANTLFDENYGGRFGNCHIALGSAYAASFDGDAAKQSPLDQRRLGFNASALHWDLVNTEQKRVTAELSTGGRLVIYENGQFTEW